MMTPTISQRIALIVPIYNAAADIPFLLPAIMKQSLKPDTILFIDSSSSDNSAALLAAYPVQIHTIDKKTFDHGGTRKLATELVDADIYIYLTQDAYPESENAFYELVMALIAEDRIGCVYGRQLPKPDATPVSAHLRHFNYPATSYVRTFADRNKYGIKTCFNSDSFAAYKKSALRACGNFPNHLITGEDAYVAAKMLKAGFAVAYAASATVLHSHNLSIKEEFHRYFSIGVLHGREHWIVDDFKSPTGEGMKFVKSEVAFLIEQKKSFWIPRALLSSATKLIAYHLGLRDYLIPHAIKKKMGINKSFWLKAIAS